MSTSRIAPVEPGTRPRLADIEARILAARGRITPLYRVLLNSAPVVDGWEAMLTAIRQKTSLAPRVRELVILRVAVLNRAPYEFEAHVPHARAAGLLDEVIEGLRAGAAPDAVRGLDAGERGVLALTDTMTRDIEVPDAVFEPLRVHFDEQGLIELAATVAAYNMVSRFLVALRIGH
ncbi:carboxymuconolactone decarboxylase family protein [Bordetella sp. FB-8]|uniref:carboxymuconolactone decarboxylase family protein n=1 Tax=Bordetella sp. FB-8 TaxID=1159870 RepID=UPI00037DF64C|nr:carboxymuconolactone decarboxylase family protein [Bordetella sp. FB-8]